jgi:enolase
MKISKIEIDIIKDSRSQNTLQAKLFTQKGFLGQASVPQGKSKGRQEAISLPAQKAKELIEQKITPLLKNQIFNHQIQFDNFLIEVDGTLKKSHLGANTLLVLSLAFARVLAQEKKQFLYQYLAQLTGTSPALPSFYMNLINGGEHAKNTLEWQEYMIVVKAKTAQDQLKIGQDIFYALEDKFKKMNQKIDYGDEGGYDINLKDYEQPLKILNQVIENLNYSREVKIALDLAANNFSSKEGRYYNLKEVEITSEKLREIYLNICQNYSIISLEDPFEESCSQYYATLKQELEQKSLVIGDDLTVTNPDILKQIIQKDAIDGLIIKPNQIGTLTETIETIKLAKRSNLKIIVSHRSGETEDDFIADLAYASAAFGLKAGAPNPKTQERLLKYERIIQISK